MKRVLVVFMALLLSATFVGAVLAQDNANPALQQFNTKSGSSKIHGL